MEKDYSNFSNCDPKILIEIIQVYYIPSMLCYMAKLRTTEYNNDIFPLTDVGRKILISHEWEESLDNTTISYNRTSCPHEIFPKMNLGVPLQITRWNLTLPLWQPDAAKHWHRESKSVR